MQITEEEIEAARTSKGGWTRKALEAWGVAWPPTKGWKTELLLRGKANEGDHTECDSPRASPLKPRQGLTGPSKGQPYTGGRGATGQSTQ